MKHHALCARGCAYYVELAAGDAIPRCPHGLVLNLTRRLSLDAVLIVGGGFRWYCWRHPDDQEAEPVTGELHVTRDEAMALLARHLWRAHRLRRPRRAPDQLALETL